MSVRHRITSTALVDNVIGPIVDLVVGLLLISNQNGCILFGSAFVPRCTILVTTSTVGCTLRAFTLQYKR